MTPHAARAQLGHARAHLAPEANASFAAVAAAAERLAEIARRTGAAEEGRRARPHAMRSWLKQTADVWRLLKQLRPYLGAGRGLLFADIVGRTADALASYADQPETPGRWRDFVPAETLRTE